MSLFLVNCYWLSPSSNIFVHVTWRQGSRESMADFQTSTHRAKWIFTQKDLFEKYKGVNQRAIQLLEKCGTTRVEVDIDGSFTYPNLRIGANENDDRNSRPKVLNIEEEAALRVHFHVKLQEVCRAFGFPHKIQATAVTYFKRFYLHWSVMQHHPKDIMLTCIYVACKIEENHVSAEELGKGIKQDHQVILNHEMLVLQSLGFDLIVYTPYRSIEGFTQDMEDFCHATNGRVEMLKDLLTTAYMEADKLMLTDAILLFPPGQLAMHALCRANKVHRVLDFERYLRSVLSRQQSQHPESELIQAFNTIDLLVKKLRFCDEKELKSIARKLKSCQEPGSHDDRKKEKKSKHKSKRSSHPAEAAQ